MKVPRHAGNIFLVFQLATRLERRVGTDGQPGYDFTQRAYVISRLQQPKAQCLLDLPLVRQVGLRAELQIELECDQMRCTSSLALVETRGLALQHKFGHGIVKILGRGLLVSVDKETRRFAPIRANRRASVSVAGS